MEYNNVTLDKGVNLCNRGNEGKKLSIAWELDLESITSKVLLLVKLHHYSSLNFFIYKMMITIEPISQSHSKYYMSFYRQCMSPWHRIRISKWAY